MTYIQSQDGFFYSEPIIESPKVIFRFEEGTQILTVKAFAKTTKTSAAKTAREFLKTANIKHEPLRHMYGDDGCMFPPDYQTCQGFVFETRIKSPICVPQHHEGKTERPGPDWPFIAFSLSFKKDDLIAAFEGRPFPRLLAAYLLGDSFIEDARIKECLLGRLKGIKKYKKNPLKWFETQPEKITL